MQRHSPQIQPMTTSNDVQLNGSPSKPPNDDGETEKLLPLHVTNGHESATTTGPSQAKKVGTALFYATSSLGVIFANKIVLSTYKFPSVQTLALFQFTSTTIALKIALRMVSPSGDEAQGGEWIPSGCCSLQECGHPRAACQRR